MGPMENNFNRVGADLGSFDLSTADPAACMQECNGNQACRAWTYVQPGIQGPNPRCWLKREIPVKTPNDCCVSGIKVAIQSMGEVRNNANRVGHDFASFDLPQSDPRLCQAECAGNRQCKAWTYVRPHVQGNSPRCWLKNAEPPLAQDSCCVSGLKAVSIDGGTALVPN